jgi:hypothetical protein
MKFLRRRSHAIDETGPRCKGVKLIGVGSPVLSWFESYLFNRKQQVVIDGQYSQWKI